MANEIVSVSQANQFQGASQEMCGFFAVAMLTSAAPVGQPPVKSPAQVISDAMNWYAQYNGNIYSVNGMSYQQLDWLLIQVKWEHYNLNNNKGLIAASLKSGNPVIVAVEEASVYDYGLNRNPYPWNPVYNHVILLTGIDPNGNYLVRDSANIQAPNTLRPGPRVYDANRLVLISATECKPHFAPVIPPAPPFVAVAAGWTDNGKELRGRNGIPVVLGFRAHMLPLVKSGAWGEFNEAQEPEFALGDGSSAQIFDKVILRYDKVRGVYEQSAGQVLSKTMSVISSGKVCF